MSKVKDVPLNVQARRDYYIYGTSTIEDRAIVGPDGLKPVMRRALWAIKELGANHRAKTIKGAKMVGETLGNYHPHGDKSVYDALVGATMIPQPLIFGDGNWGSMTTSAAAMRYTNGRLSKYSDLVFFDPFYLPMMEFSSNYDGTRREPVTLNTLLPNGLLNGNFGICPGVNTRTPAFTLGSVVGVLKKLLEEDRKCKVRDCKDLVWISDFGGKLTSNNGAALKEFFDTGVATVEWKSSFKLDDKLNAIRYTRFAPFSTNDKAKAGEKSPIEKLLAKIKEINGVSSVEDDSDEKDPYRQAYLIRFGKSVKGKSRDKTIKQVDRCFRTTQRMDVKVTDRALDAKMDLVDVKLRPATVPQLLTEWIEYRKGLEVRATKHWIKNLDVEIRELEVLRLAIAKLDLLFKLIKDETLTDEEVLKQVRAGLNVNEDEARWVMNRNLWQLRRMTDKGLKAKIDELNEYRSTLVERNKRPAKYILKDLDRLVKELT